MADDLATVLGDVETSSLEFKQSAKDTSKILEAICALSNDLPQHGGGSLLVGVDKNGNPVDCDTSDQALLALTDMRDNGKIIDRPSMVVDRALFKGKLIVQIRVEASSTPPVRLDGRVWVRPGPTTRLANRDDERILTEKRKAFDTPFDLTPVEGSTLDDLDQVMFEGEVMPAFVAAEVRAENGRPRELRLASLKLATSDGTPTVLGILLIGVDPTAFLPGAYVQFVRYAGADVAAPVVDAQEIRANLIDLADRLLNVLRSHLHTAVAVVDGFREDEVPDYPLDALREACMNAIIHRNYQTSNAPIRIVWFDDRIEITNAGGAYGQVNEINFERMNDYRNPSLAGAMKELGYVNRFGRGIGRMNALFERNGSPLPEFSVERTSWTVVMRRPA